MLPIEHAINLFLEMGHLYHEKQKLTRIITLQKILSSIGKRTKRIPVLASLSGHHMFNNINCFTNISDQLMLVRILEFLFYTKKKECIPLLGKKSCPRYKEWLVGASSQA